MGNGIDGNRLGVVTIPRSPDPYVDALFGVYAWSLDASRTITYSYPNPVTSFLGVGSTQVPFNSNLANTTFSTLRPAVTQILASYANVANINFAQVPDNADGAGDIRLIVSIKSPTTVGAFTILPIPSEVAAGWAGDDYLFGNVLFDNTPGSYGYMTVLHELGHALGLKHPGNYNGGGSGTPPFFPSASQDTTALSVMSYNDDARINGYPWKPGIADIKALQYIYGANMRAAPGDDTYMLNAARMETIWDPNGVNTLDGSAVSGDQTISLAEYSFSFARGKITGALAAGTKIANAVGGSGNDVIQGNDLDNRIRGGEGNDQINGGGGLDTAVYAGRKAQYSITIGADHKTATVAATPGAPLEGIDQLTNVEALQFSDRIVVIDRTALKPVGVSIADQLSVVYLGRGVGAEYRDGIASQVANGPSVDMQQTLFFAAVSDGVFSFADNNQTIVNQTFLNIFGVQATAFEQNAWASTVSSGAVTLQKLPWTIFVSYLGATNVPASYQVPAQSRIIAADAFSNLIGSDADAKLGMPGGTAAATARSWLLSIRTQTDAARKVATSGTDVNSILTTNKFSSGAPLDPDTPNMDSNATADYSAVDLAPLIGIA